MSRADVDRRNVSPRVWRPKLRELRYWGRHVLCMLVVLLAVLPLVFVACRCTP